MDDKLQDILDGMPEKPPRSSLEPYRELSTNFVGAARRIEKSRTYSQRNAKFTPRRVR